jgi:hypothetical protein
MAGLLRAGTVGILPAGALGVAFFHHLTEGGAGAGRVFFMQRVGSQSAAAIREGRSLRIKANETIQDVSLADIWLPDLLRSAENGWLPEVILVCTQPDQLLGVVQNAVDLLVKLSDRLPMEEAIESVPCLVLCSNGIYFQRVRQVLVEKLEEATLFGRLPDLWPDSMPAIVAKLLRGVTIQTGQREGTGTAAVYIPGISGRTRIAGGSKQGRERCGTLLSDLGGWFEVAEGASPTRVEFEKALVNLTANLLGQLRAIDDRGNFRRLTIREILAGEARTEARQLAEQVVAVGRAVHAFHQDEPLESFYEEAVRSCEEHLDHVPSSLQWIELQLRKGELQARLSPTEAWLLEPLVRYAHAAGLEDAAHYFEELARRVEARLALAIGRTGRENAAGPVSAPEKNNQRGARL